MLEHGEIVCQVDFAENASIISQVEIQSAHGSHELVTIFICVIWTATNTHSFVVISDDLSHSKYSVWVI